MLTWGSPHLPFQLFGARATHTPELRNPPCSPCHGFSPGAQERIVDGSARLTGLHYYPYKGQPFFYGGTVRPRNDRAPPKTQLNKTLRAPYRAGLKLFLTERAATTFGSKNTSKVAPSALGLYKHSRKCVKSQKMMTFTCVASENEQVARNWSAHGSRAINLCFAHPTSRRVPIISWADHAP